MTVSLCQKQEPADIGTFPRRGGNLDEVSPPPFRSPDEPKKSGVGRSGFEIVVGKDNPFRPAVCERNEGLNQTN